jgi:DNA-binding IclR family transcriptional regulator
MRYKNGERPKQIVECLRKAAPRDLSIEEIATGTGIHRNTVSKYVYSLEKEGKITLTRQVGGAKFYTVKEGRG